MDCELHKKSAVNVTVQAFHPWLYTMALSDYVLKALPDSALQKFSASFNNNLVVCCGVLRFLDVLRLALHRKEGLLETYLENMYTLFTNYEDH